MGTGASRSDPVYMKIVTDHGADLVAGLITVAVIYFAGIAERGGSSAVRIPPKTIGLYLLEQLAGKMHRRAWRQAIFWKQVQREAQLRYDLETYRG